MLKRRPRQLSGGQQQRVALGRALVRDPAAFLFDEPLSNLDAKLRAAMRTELIKLHRMLGRTIVHVTHDQVEAMTMGERICIMRDGRIVQVGPPLEVYRNPADTFVAGFLASPPMNLLDARFGGPTGLDAVELPPISLPLLADHKEALRDRAGRTITLGIRPEESRRPSFRRSAWRDNRHCGGSGGARAGSDPGGGTPRRSGNLGPAREPTSQRRQAPKSSSTSISNACISSTPTRDAP